MELGCWQEGPWGVTGMGMHGCGGSFPVLNDVARGGLTEEKQHLSEDLKER